jgi:hypothetical protein
MSAVPPKVTGGGFRFGFRHFIVGVVLLLKERSPRRSRSWPNMARIIIIIIIEPPFLALKPRPRGTKPDGISHEGPGYYIKIGYIYG